jgi:hypothetical protein
MILVSEVLSGILWDLRGLVGWFSDIALVTGALLTARPVSKSRQEIIFRYQCTKKIFRLFRKFSGLPDPLVGGSSHHQAEGVRKTVISAVLWLLSDVLSVNNDVNVLLKSYKQQGNFLFAFWKSLTKKAGSRAGSVSHGSGTLLFNNQCNYVGNAWGFMYEYHWQE